ncbi:MAG: hypothetical protein LBQ34_00525 [Alphaproteobacteria bacterium]|jgi:hypothetical protein|nr:hypothetical protein [Alphaproteobacteria bacterium]
MGFSYLNKIVKCLGVFLIASLVFAGVSMAASKEDEAKDLVAIEIFNKQKDIAGNFGGLQFFMPNKDNTTMSVSLIGNSYKIKYLPTPYLEITMDYDRGSSKVIAGNIQSRLLDTPEKVEFYRNNFLILAKLIDNKLSMNEFNNIYAVLDINKARTEPRFFKIHISNDYFYNMDANSRRTQIFTVKIRKSNKNDVEELNLVKDINDSFNKALAKIGGGMQTIYPEVSRASIKNRNLFFYSSQNVSMNLLVETGFMGAINPISGNITYEGQKDESRTTDFNRDALVLILLTNSKLSFSDAKEILNSLDVNAALENSKYYKNIAGKTNVYTLSYIKGKLTLTADVRTAEFDRKARIEALVLNQYNNIIAEFNLTDSVRPLNPQDLTTYILNKQNVVVFRPSQLMLFRIYLNDKDDSVLRINIVLPKVAVDKNLEAQRSNALIAIRMLNPQATRQEAESIFSYLKDAYGTVETRMMGEFRYKRCTYKDETLVFSRYDPKEVIDDGNQVKDTSNIAAYNPNLLYEPEANSPSNTTIVKPQPLCY